MKVLVLGHKGMLGHMVSKYLRDNKVEVVTSDVRWPESPFKPDIKLDYDNDQIVSPPFFELTYTDKDNLEINKKIVKALKKIYQPLNHKISINHKVNDKIKIGFISEFFTDHTIGKLFKNLIFSLDLKFFDVVIYHSNKTKKGKIFDEFQNRIKKGFKNEILPNKLIDKIKIIIC